MHADVSLERRRERQVANELGRLYIGDVEDDKPTRAVREIRSFAPNVCASMKQRPELDSRLTPSRPLTVTPPARDLNWTCRIADIDDLIDVTVVALGQGRRVNIRAARVEIAVRALPSGTVDPELLRIFRVRQIPDDESFAVGAGLISPSLRDSLLGRDH